MKRRWSQAELGRFLPESNAILFYLAEGTPLPSDDWGRGQPRDLREAE